MSRLKARGTSHCNCLSLFSTFLPVQPGVQITAHIRIYNLAIDITCLKPFRIWGFAPKFKFWWAKTNVEKGCWA